MKHSAIKHCPKYSSSPAADLLIRKYMPLVHRIARQMSNQAPSGMGHDDLLSAGSIGLIQSILRSRSNRGGPFSGYARIRIRGAISDEMRTNRWRPRRQSGQNSTTLESSLPRPVVIPLGDLSHQQEFFFCATDNETDPFHLLTRKQRQTDLETVFDALNPRDRLVVHLHYFRGMHMREIGRLLRISEARVSQIHHRALRQARVVLSCDR